MEVIHPRCAGIDVSKKDAKVCVRHEVSGQTRYWGTVQATNYEVTQYNQSIYALQTRRLHAAGTLASLVYFALPTVAIRPADGCPDQGLCPVRGGYRQGLRPSEHEAAKTQAREAIRGRVRALGRIRTRPPLAFCNCSRHSGARLTTELPPRQLSDSPQTGPRKSSRAALGLSLIAANSWPLRTQTSLVRIQ